jgi:hypothetical protein
MDKLGASFWKTRRASKNLRHSLPHRYTKNAKFCIKNNVFVEK